MPVFLTWTSFISYNGGGALYKPKKSTCLRAVSSCRSARQICGSPILNLQKMQWFAKQSEAIYVTANICKPCAASSRARVVHALRLSRIFPADIQLSRLLAAQVSPRLQQENCPAQKGLAENKLAENWQSKQFFLNVLSVHCDFLIDVDFRNATLSIIYTVKLMDFPLGFFIFSSSLFLLILYWDGGYVLDGSSMFKCWCCACSSNNSRLELLRQLHLKLCEAHCSCRNCM